MNNIKAAVKLRMPDAVNVKENNLRRTQYKCLILKL